MKFHECRGLNISLSNDGKAAARTHGFSNGIVFSSRPIRPNEVFTILIEEIQPDWSGNLRCGFTWENIDRHFEVPEYSLPGMTNQGKTRVIALPTKIAISDELKDEGSPKHVLLDEGTTIGLKYNLKGQIHLIINHTDLGPVVQNVLINQDVYAIVDIYGSTTKVKVLSPEVQPLHEICTVALSRLVPKAKISALPLPRKFIKSLQSSM
ncbi:Neuralized-like protein 2 [Trichoplax sp. H2]|uniref:NHR domain-containing protein n=1 Tax=Trichoplax adhaerens TaxID=10228 RepID=B3RVD6_TRIAD|nr:hypothetical protein TRIADDRAFT_55615 [Trichoplax adhaerens]EDV25976.1 hypothetical protein TRIADDRAFT_55615 [Trichoplax adhaerens]RDD46895.1 Neuralized-like protein 2 [Trichoplax sp. H2]|eukprot:XP_002112009.1 hypothetical protein TRIADDRAFT_55615 [Trichoplax adhaerens]